MVEFTLAPIENLLKEQGAPRVAKDATKLFAEELERLSLEIAKDAAALAAHSGRKTVSRKDIKAAMK